MLLLKNTKNSKLAALNFFKLFLTTCNSLKMCFSFCLFFDTGAKPVFPGKGDKDKPKFAVKGQKQTTEYPFLKTINIQVTIVHALACTIKLWCMQKFPEHERIIRVA